MGARCRQWESLVSIRIVGLSVYELLSVLLFDGSSGPLSRESSAKVRRIYETTNIYLSPLFSVSSASSVCHY